MPAKCALLITVLVAAFAGRAHADFDHYCSLPGFAPTLRQTVILIDEHQVFAEPDGNPSAKNRPWRQFIGAFVLPDNQNLLQQNFAPRERVSVVLVRKDGGGTKQIFSGCLPTFSAAEQNSIRQSGGVAQHISEFFGRGAISGATHDMDLFRIQLGNAVTAALQPEMLSTSERGGSLSQSGFTISLRQGKLFNPYFGVPRLVFYSDLSRFFRSFPQGADEARTAGFKLGQEADLDLGGAEVYVAGVGGNAPGAMRDGMAAFFLMAHGDLAAISSPGALPAFAAAPRRVARFQGSIRYPDISFPIRVRLTSDENGSLVNSWLWVQTSKEQFAPLHGVLTCEPTGACTYAGDQVFAQIWNVKRRAGTEPELSPSLPFGGARMLDLHLTGDALAGAISDPQVRFEGLKSQKLEFYGKRQPAASF